MNARRSVAYAVSAALLATLSSAVPAAALSSATASGQPSAPFAATAADMADPKPTIPTTGIRQPKDDLRTKNQAAAPAARTVLIKFKAGTPTATRDRLLARIHGAVTRTLSGGYLKITTSGTAADAMKALRTDAAIDEVALDQAVYADSTPNDSLYAAYQSAYLKTVRLPQAWDLQKSATSVIIAVVDTGVDGGHPDLAGRVLAGYNSVSNSTNVTDTVGHGTMVAGVAAANTNNSRGVAGAAWNGRILPVKVFTGDVAYDSDIAEGVRWAADHGAKIINLSLGGSGTTPLTRSAIAYAIGKGALVVAAAGNTGSNEPHYPGAYPEVLTVGATDSKGNLTDFSTFGDNVDIAAPGWDITSTYPRQSNCYDCYGFGWSGTSFSAPLVSGVAALVKTKYPSLTPAQLMARLKATARDAGPRGIDPYYGAGILDAYAALGGTPTSAFPQRALGVNEPDDVPDRATTLTTTSYIESTIAMEGDADWYRIDRTEPRPLTITVTPPTYNDLIPQNMDPVLTLFDSQFRRLDEADVNDATGFERITAGLGIGAYYIRVKNYNGAADLRNYRIEATDGDYPVTFDRNLARGIGQTVPESVAVGDVTGDGRPDVVLTTGARGVDPAAAYKLAVFAEDASRVPGQGVTYDLNPTPGLSEHPGIAILDANGDGRNDIAVGQLSGVQLFLQTPAGTLSPGVMLPDVGKSMYIAAADLDGDGDQDLVTAATGVHVLTQKPGGVFSVSAIADEATSYGSVSIGDVNGDNRPDVITHTLTNPSLEVFLNLSDGSWPHTSLSLNTTGAMYDIEVVDFTGDGRADVVAAVGGAEAGKQLVLYRQKLDGTLDQPQDILPAQGCSSQQASLAWVDWDVDGHPDLVSSGCGGILLARRQGDGSYLPTAPVLPAPTAGQIISSPQAFTYGDLDNDGYPDSVATLMGDLPGYSISIGYNVNGPGPNPQLAFIRGTSVADFGKIRAPGTTITIRTARSLDPATVNGQTVKLLDGVTGGALYVKVSYDATTHKITLTRPLTLADGTVKLLPLATSGHPYRLVIGAIKDTDGNTSAGYTMTFVG